MKKSTNKKKTKEKPHTNIKNIDKFKRFKKKIKTWVNDWKPIIDLIGTILVLFSVIIAFLALNSAVENSELNKQISKYNKELVDWYKNPQVVLQIWDDTEKRLGEDGRFWISTTLIANNYSLDKGIESEINYKRKIDFWIYNAGRKPLTATYMSAYIEVDEPLTTPFPFKFYEIITPVTTLKYDTQNKQMVKEVEGVIPIFANSLNKSDFPPTIFFEWENGSITEKKLLFPTTFTMGSIGPGETINFHILLFSTRENVTGNLVCKITGKDIEEYITVPIKS